MLHLRIAKAVERRSGNRLRSGSGARASLQPGGAPTKPFVYMAMAGAKSLRIDSFEEAGRCFDAAFSLLHVGAAVEMGRSRDWASLIIVPEMIGPMRGTVINRLRPGSWLAMISISPDTS